jgi:hypothetical protein
LQEELAFAPNERLGEPLYVDILSVSCCLIGISKLEEGPDKAFTALMSVDRHPNGVTVVLPLFATGQADADRIVYLTISLALNSSSDRPTTDRIAHIVQFDPCPIPLLTILPLPLLHPVYLDWVPIRR